LLCQAETALGYDNPRAARLAEQALARGTLDTADRAYASGLIATDLATAATHFAAAAEARPWHLAAGQFYAYTLILQRRGPEARSGVAPARPFFPNEPTLLLLDAMLSALAGDRVRADHLLGQLRSALGPGAARRLEGLVEYCEAMRELEPWIYQSGLA